MGAGFGGEVASYYAKYRRGYPPAVIDFLVAAFGLSEDDIVLDLGCGTGQLARPIADRVRAVVAVDPEPEMLALARHAAAERRAANITWTLGTDSDVPAVGALLPRRALAAVTLGNAIHLMDHQRLFRTTLPLLRPGGGIAVIANGTPLWQQDSACSRALRTGLERWFNTSLTSACGTDSVSRGRYAEALAATGYGGIRETVLIDRTETLDLDHLVGSLYSAIPCDQLPPPAQRPTFAEHIQRAVHPHLPFTEHIRVVAVTGQVLPEPDVPAAQRPADLPAG